MEQPLHIDAGVVYQVLDDSGDHTIAVGFSDWQAHAGITWFIDDVDAWLRLEATAWGETGIDASGATDDGAILVGAVAGWEFRRDWHVVVRGDNLLNQMWVSATRDVGGTDRAVSSPGINGRIGISTEW